MARCVAALLSRLLSPRWCPSPASTAEPGLGSSGRAWPERRTERASSGRSGTGCAGPVEVERQVQLCDQFSLKLPRSTRITQLT
jgi:hypothetical protein